MKTVLLLNICALTFWSCNPKQTPDSQTIDTVVATKTTASPDTLNNNNKTFSQIAFFPTINDSIKFISELLDKYDLEVDNDNPTTKGSITAYRKMWINGSDKDFILVEYDWKDGCMADFPWKYQLIFTNDGKHLKTLSADRYDFIQIFPNQNPFLLALIVTAKGNGGHEIYKVTADTFENVYEGYYDYEVRTYDAHGDNTLYEPHELQLTVQDKNGDRLNDLVFRGKLLYDDDIRKYTKQIEFIFIYDKQSGNFKAKKKYENVY